MVHAKFRGDRIYIYQSWRTKTGQIRSKYLGTFEAWFRRESEQSLVPPDISILSKLLSKKDRMDENKKMILADLLVGIKYRYHDSAPEEKRLTRAGRVAEAKYLQSQGWTYRRIAKRFGVSAKTVWKYVNR